MLVYTCPECKTLLLIPGSWAGMRTECPECMAAIEVPAPALPADEPVIVWQRPGSDGGA